jgi:hypothetical protein
MTRNVQWPADSAPLLPELGPVKARPAAATKGGASLVAVYPFGRLAAPRFTGMAAAGCSSGRFSNAQRLLCCLRERLLL